MSIGNIENILGGPFTVSNVSSIKSVLPVEVQASDAMRGTGLNPPANIVFDGKVHRFDADKKGDKACWYIFFSDNIPAGRFGNWKSGLECPWRADIGRSLTPVEESTNARRMAEARQIRDAEMARTHEVSLSVVQKIWSEATLASDEHPYLQRKGIKGHGARVTGDGRLIVPLRDIDGSLASLQYIDADGGKLYHPGAAVSGKFLIVGASDDPGTIYLAEGFATAATIYEVTGRPCVAAYSASNLVPVLGELRENYGTLQDIVIVADNDASGVGQKYAEQASAKHGARVVVPPEPGDANDYRQAGGDLGTLLVPKIDEWIEQADDFSEQPAPVAWLVKHWLQEQALIMVHGPSGGGKAQPLDELILTPTGWKTMGEITVGSYVIGSAGLPVKVTAIYPQGMKPEWRVSFSNGAVVRCCDEHLWTVRKSNDGRPQILTTAEIAKKPHKTWWKVPKCAPISYESNLNPLPLDPYLLGALIGDGGITAYVGFSSKDDEIIDCIRRVLPEGHEISKKIGGNVDYQITSLRGQPNHVWTALRLLGLAGKTSQHKFIPDEYMKASPYDRLAMLQGLMDTDGYVSAGNGTTVDFSNSSLRLVEQVSELVSSLGGLPNSIRTKKTSGIDCHTVTFRMGNGVNPFRLTRKADRCRTNGHNLEIRVLSAEPTGRMVPMQCISVASNDSLYVTNGYILTHNTFVVLDWCLRMAAGVPEWFGSRVKDGSVLYLAGEGHHGLKGRVAAWKIRHGTGRRLTMWLSKSGCDLNTAEGYHKVIESIRRLPSVPNLIVVDTLHRFLMGDENSAQDAKGMLDACAGLMGEFGCSVLLVHHTGVNEEAQHRARGSSAWRGALDIEISIVPAKDGAPMQIVQRKSKDAEMVQPVYAELASVEIPGWIDEDGEQVTSAVLEQSEAPTAVITIDAKLAAHRKTFEKAWWASGAELRDGQPYVSRSSLREKLAEGGKKSDRTIENEMTQSYSDKLIGTLMNSNSIAKFEHGWVAIDDSWASVLIISMP